MSASTVIVASTHSFCVGPRCRTPAASDRWRAERGHGYRSCCDNRRADDPPPTAAILFVGLLLQPLSAQQPSQMPARHCADEASDSPGASTDEKPTHNGSNCRHSGALCAVVQTQLARLSAPPIVPFAVLPTPPSALLEAPNRHTRWVRQSPSRFDNPQEKWRTA